MSTVNITTGSGSGGGDQPPNNDPEYEFDELAPIEDNDEQEAANENENPHRPTKQSLVDAVRVAAEHFDSLQAQLTDAEAEAAALRSRINDKILESNRTRVKQSTANRVETEREAAAVIDLRVKWREKQIRALASPGTTFENPQTYDAAKTEHARLAAIALATFTQYASEIATLTVEREDLQVELDIANITVTSLKRQLAEAETVRKEKREELATLRDVEQIEQQEAVEAAQEQQQSIQQSQQPSSHDDQVPAIQLLPSSHQQPPPPQSSGVQQQQKTPTSASQQTDVPSTVDVTGTQSVTLTETILSRVEPMDQTLPNRGPPSSSNEPMSTGQSSESASAHDDEMKSLNTSFEQHQLDPSLPPEPNYGSVLDNYPQAGFDPLARTEAPSLAQKCSNTKVSTKPFPAQLREFGLSICNSIAIRL